MFYVNITLNIKFTYLLMLSVFSVFNIKFNRCGVIMTESWRHSALFKWWT